MSKQSVVIAKSRGAFRWKLLGPRGAALATSGQSFQTWGKAETAARSILLSKTDATWPTKPARVTARKTKPTTARKTKPAAQRKRTKAKKLNSGYKVGARTAARTSKTAPIGSSA